MRVEPDPWLAGVLGLEVFRVALGPEGGSAEVPPFALLARGRTRAFYYARLPTLQVQRARRLCAEGFAVAEVGVTFERPPGAGEPETVPGLVVRDARPSDREPVLAFAGGCFRYDRFHQDPLFTRDQADSVKREWVRSYFEGKRGERLLVAELEGEPRGFLAVLAGTASDRPCRVIDLVGVASAWQGRGVGRALVRHFLGSYTGACDLLRVGTQLTNVPSTRLYEQCGFRLADSNYVLHAHVRYGRVVS